MTENTNYPDVLFIHLGDVKEGDTYFAEHWPEASAVADKKKHYYRAVNLEKANLSQVLSPSSLKSAFGAMRSGNRQSKTTGDPMQMPGALLLDNDGSIIWQHIYKHVGDNPNWLSIPHAA